MSTLLVEEFGPVRRSECVCGDVIVIATNASDLRISEAIARHNATAAHTLYATLTGRDNASEDRASVVSHADDAVIRIDSPGSVAGVSAGVVLQASRLGSSPPSPTRGLRISPLGYDFDE
jgi:hypothetical protein